MTEQTNRPHIPGPQRPADVVTFQNEQPGGELLASLTGQLSMFELEHPEDDPLIFTVTISAAEYNTDSERPANSSALEQAQRAGWEVQAKPGLDASGQVALYELTFTKPNVLAQTFQPPRQRREPPQ